MSAKVHLAGNMVTIGAYFVQRCLLCGAVLQEGNTRDMASPDNGPTVYPLQCGAFYEHEVTPGCTRTTYVQGSNGPHFDSDLDLPDGCCVRG